VLKQTDGALAVLEERREEPAMDHFGEGQARR
jgi:hypothetical protein